MVYVDRLIFALIGSKYSVRLPIGQSDIEPRAICCKEHAELDYLLFSYEKGSPQSDCGEPVILALRFGAGGYRPLAEQRKPVVRFAYFFSSFFNPALESSDSLKKSSTTSSCGGVP